MRKLKRLDDTFCFYGAEFGIKQCCLIWFYNVYQTLRAEIPEYMELMHIMSNNTGIMYCPECVIKKLEKGGG